MVNFSQKGVVHIFVLVILVLGLVAGLYLVQHPQIFKPRAYDPNSPVVCKFGLNSFAVNSECSENRFAESIFQCHDGLTISDGSIGVGTTVTVSIPVSILFGNPGNVGIGSSMNIGIITSGNVGIGTTVLNSGGCRTSLEWSELARNICQNRSSCQTPSTPTPTPPPLPIPSPTPYTYPIPVPTTGPIYHCTLSDESTCTPCQAPVNTCRSGNGTKYCDLTSHPQYGTNCIKLYRVAQRGICTINNCRPSDSCNSQGDCISPPSTLIFTLPTPGQRSFSCGTATCYNPPYTKCVSQTVGVYTNTTCGN